MHGWRRARARSAAGTALRHVGGVNGLEPWSFSNGAPAHAPQQLPTAAYSYLQLPTAPYSSLQQLDACPAVDAAVARQSSPPHLALTTTHNTQYTTQPNPTIHGQSCWPHFCASNTTFCAFIWSNSS